MQTIIRGSMAIMKLLPAAKGPENGLYRPSRYVLRAETEDGSLLCNTLTGEMALLSPEEKKLFDALPSEGSSELTELLRHRYVVPSELREDQTADQLRALMMKRRESANIIAHYVILPTTFCNARCFYCCQSGTRHVHMSDETAEKLVEFIAGHRKNEKVRLEWFGGEPMLGKDRIDRICDLLRDREIPFGSSMISNGFLFDERSVRHAAERWNLKSIQITLDGTEDVYNRTKAYAGVSESPYRRVLRNIGLLDSEGIRVDIRLNMDSHNADDLEKLIAELSERFSGSKNIFVYAARLIEGVGFDPIRHSEKDAEALDRRMAEVRDRLKNSGWPQYGRKELPRLKVISCMADDPRTVLCTPEGIFGKCLDKIYLHTAGNLDSGVSGRDDILWWRERRAFDGCAECPLYPSCDRMLKHCPGKTGPCDAQDKAGRIDGIREFMAEEYKKWKRDWLNAGKES